MLVNNLLKVHSRKKAIMFLFLAALLWSLGGLFIKSIEWNALGISGVRSFFAAMLVFMFVPEARCLPKNKAVWFASFAYVGMVSTLVMATKLTTSANAIFLQYTAPIYVAVLSAWLLKQKVSLKDWVVIGATGLGMVLFFVGELSFKSITGNACGIISGICFATMVICFRYIKDAEPSSVILWGNLFAFLVTIPFWEFPLPTGYNWLALLFLGFFQLGLPYLIYSRSLQYVTPLEGVLIPTVEPILNPIWVFLVIGEQPSFWAICGAVVVVTAVTYYCLQKATVNNK